MHLRMCGQSAAQLARNVNAMQMEKCSQKGLYNVVVFITATNILRSSCRYNSWGRGYMSRKKRSPIKGDYRTGIYRWEQVRAKSTLENSHAYSPVLSGALATGFEACVAPSEYPGYGPSKGWLSSSRSVNLIVTSICLKYGRPFRNTKNCVCCLVDLSQMGFPVARIYFVSTTHVPIWLGGQNDNETAKGKNMKGWNMSVSRTRCQNVNMPRRFLRVSVINSETAA